MKDEYLHIFLASFFTLLFLCLSIQKIHCYDIWWHLATGKWIWAHKTIPRQDIFSYTQRGRPWTDFTWGFQTLIYPIYKWGGTCGLVLFKTLVLALSFFFLYKTLRLGTKNALLIWFLMFSVLLASYPRFMVRPHIFSFLFVSLFLYGLSRYRQGLNTGYLLLLCLSFVFWVNIHGSFIIGIFLVSAYLLGESVSRYNWQVREVLKLPLIKGLVTLCILLIFLSFFNPYGFKLLKFAIFSHIGEGAQATKYIAEWQGLPFKEIFLFKFNQTLFFKLIFWSAILSFIFARRPLVLRDIFIFCLLAYLTFKHARFMGLFAFAVAPAVSYWMPRLKKENLFYVGLLCLTLFFITKSLILSPYFKKDLGTGITKGLYPVQTTAFLKRHRLKGNLFNSYGFGGYLIWHLYPKYKVFIDGRTPTIYPPEFYFRYRIVEDGHIKSFQRLAPKYNIGIVLTKSKSLAQRLKKNREWSLIGFDDRAYLLAKTAALSPSEKPLLYFDPTIDIEGLIAQYKKKKQLSLLISDLKQAQKAFPEVILIHSDLGLIYAEKGDYQRAILSFKQALRLNPYNPIGYYNLGLAYKKAKKWSLAIKAFKRVLSFNKRYAEAYYHLGLIYYQKKDYQAAIRHLKKYCELVGDETVPSAYEYLGLSYYKTLYLDRAIKYFKRAVFLARSKEEEKKNLYNLGNCYFGLAKYKVAAEYYERALKIDPHFEKAKFNLEKAKERLK